MRKVPCLRSSSLRRSSQAPAKATQRTHSSTASPPTCSILAPNSSIRGPLQAADDITWFAEFWAGAGGVTEACSKIGLATLPPIEAFPPTGYQRHHDLSRVEVQRFYLELGESFEQPILVFLVLPGGSFSGYGRTAVVGRVAPGVIFRTLGSWQQTRRQSS